MCSRNSAVIDRYYAQVNPANERMLGGGGADGGNSFSFVQQKMN